MDPQNPIHWGYPPWGITPPVPSTKNGSNSFKRTHSETDECDDVFSEESSSKEQCSSPSDQDSCQMLSRKRRRGIIEKRRRDKINTSLSELRRLVPTAYEKQGSAKLEKAEILQMTVDHLKMLHAKGIDVLAYDSSKFALDYHSMGYRECASEVARYLVTVEGLDIHDPLRLRLISHLQNSATQREFAAAKPTPWYPGANLSSNTSHNYQSTSTLSPLGPPPSVPSAALPLTPPHGMGLHHHHQQQQQQQQHQHNNNNQNNNNNNNSSLDASGSSLNSSGHSLNSSFETNNNNTSCGESTTTSSISRAPPPQSSSLTLTPLTTVSSVAAQQDLYNPASSYHHVHHQHQQHASMNIASYHHMMDQQAPHHMHHQQAHHPYAQLVPDPSIISSQMKPYRPWGGEVAY